MAWGREDEGDAPGPYDVCTLALEADLGLTHCAKGH